MLEKIIEALRNEKGNATNVQNLLIAADHMLSDIDDSNILKETYIELAQIAEETYSKAFDENDYSHPMLLAIASEYRKKASSIEMASL